MSRSPVCPGGSGLGHMSPTNWTHLGAIDINSRTEVERIVRTLLGH